MTRQSIKWLVCSALFLAIVAAGMAANNAIGAERPGSVSAPAPYRANYARSVDPLAPTLPEAPYGPREYVRIVRYIEMP